MQVGEKIKKLRELRNFTQEHVAEKLGLTQSAYSRIESGETDVAFSKLEQIAEVLELTPADIVSFNEHVVFNIMHNQNVNGVHGTNIYNMPEEMKKLYDDHINVLTEQIEYLKSVLEKVLDK